MKNKFIIDTNVLIIANDKSPHISTHDVNSCMNFILSVYENSIVYLDSLYLILDEYFNHASHSGQPGLGDAFAKWLFNNQANNDVCKIMKITYSITDPYNFEEFPSDDCFKNFDVSDRKFVALAISAEKEPEICNGSDSDWFNYFQDFCQLGIRIKFLCEEQLNQWINM